MVTGVVNVDIFKKCSKAFSRNIPFQQPLKRCHKTKLKILFLDLWAWSWAWSTLKILKRVPKHFLGVYISNDPSHDVIGQTFKIYIFRLMGVVMGVINDKTF